MLFNFFSIFNPSSLEGITQLNVLFEMFNELPSTNFLNLVDPCKSSVEKSVVTITYYVWKLDHRSYEWQMYRKQSVKASLESI